MVKLVLDSLINKITMLPAVVTANSRDFGTGLANLKRIGASSGRRLSGRECNEIQTKNRGPHETLLHERRVNYRILPDLANGFLQLFRELSVRPYRQRTSCRNVDGESRRLPVRVVERDCSTTFVDCVCYVK